MRLYRVHFDLFPAALNAFDDSWAPYPEYHWVLADPEGNEFCVQ